MIHLENSSIEKAPSLTRALHITTTKPSHPWIYSKLTFPLDTTHHVGPEVRVHCKLYHQFDSLQPNCYSVNTSLLSPGKLVTGQLCEVWKGEGQGGTLTYLHYYLGSSTTLFITCSFISYVYCKMRSFFCALETFVCLLYTLTNTEIIFLS